MYLEAVEGIKKHLVKRTATEHLLYIAEQINDRSSPKMDHLVCFLPGVLALGVHHGLPSDHMEIAEVRLARSPPPCPAMEQQNRSRLAPLSLPPQFVQELMSTCYQMYERQPTKLAPEIVHFDQGKDSQEAARGGV